MAPPIPKLCPLDTKFNGCSLVKAWLFSHRKSGESLDILIPVVNVNPESYLEPTGLSFSLQIPRVDIVSNILLKIDEKKATSLGGYDSE